MKIDRSLSSCHTSKTKQSRSSRVVKYAHVPVQATCLFRERLVVDSVRRALKAIFAIDRVRVDCCWYEQRQAWTRARRVNRCGGALTAPSPRGRDDAMRRIVPIHIGRVLPANILACHATPQPPFHLHRTDRRASRLDQPRIGPYEADQQAEITRCVYAAESRCCKSSNAARRSERTPSSSMELAPSDLSHSTCFAARSLSRYRVEWKLAWRWRRTGRMASARCEAWTRDPTDNWTKISFQREYTLYVCV